VIRRVAASTPNRQLTGLRGNARADEPTQLSGCRLGTDEFLRAPHASREIGSEAIEPVRALTAVAPHLGRPQLFLNGLSIERAAPARLALTGLGVDRQWMFGADTRSRLIPTVLGA